MEPPQTLYKQSATHFALPLYLRKETEVNGRLIADLAEMFLSTLLFPGTQLTGLWTKRAGMRAKLNMGEFTSSRWKAAQKKILNNEYAVVDIQAQTPDFPNQKIWFTAHVNPIDRDEFLTSGMWKVACSVSYLRHIAASPERVEALLQLVRSAWNGTPGGPAYGYGNLAMTLARPIFNPLQEPPAPFPPPDVKLPTERVHAVPIAYVGNDIEGNLEASYVRDRGIKGAFWANFLSAPYVAMAGGEAILRTKLNGMRVESLHHGGLLIVATDSPLPEDTEDTRERFWRLDEALQPAFLAREQMSETMRGTLGYFYRERPALR